MQSTYVVNLVDERWDTLNTFPEIPIFIEIDVLALERLHKTFGLGIVVWDSRSAARQLRRDA